MAGIEALLIFAVAALNFSVMPGGVGTNELVADAQFGSRALKSRLQIALTVGKAVGKLKSIVRLNALNLDSPAGIPCSQLLKEIG